MSPSLTEEAVFIALRAVLLAMLPSGVEIVRGQANRVPMPGSDNFVVMTPLRREQMASTTHAYRPGQAGEDIARSTAIHFQLDVYGAGSTDNAQVITTLMRDAWAAALLKPQHIGVLYADDPRQMPLVAGEQQFIKRWIVNVALHANINVPVPMQFADSLITTLSEADQ